MPPEFIAAYTVIGLTLLVMVDVIIFLAVIKTSATVEAVNRKLELLMKHSGMNVQEVATRELQSAIREGKIVDKIEAIKRYRQLTGASLAEAKAAVEKIQSS
jgi:ribosomal protein L7/L12